jgi:hypothetical protein
MLAPSFRRPITAKWLCREGPVPQPPECFGCVFRVNSYACGIALQATVIVGRIFSVPSAIYRKFTGSREQ